MWAQICRLAKHRAVNDRNQAETPVSVFWQTLRETRSLTYPEAALHTPRQSLAEVAGTLSKQLVSGWLDVGGFLIGR